MLMHIGHGMLDQCRPYPLMLAVLIDCHKPDNIFVVASVESQKSPRAVLFHITEDICRDAPDDGLLYPACVKPFIAPGWELRVSLEPGVFPAYQSQ